METEINYWYLRNHNIFCKLSPEELKDLSVLVGFLKLKKNERVNLLQDNNKRIYFVKKGVLKVIRKEGDTEVVVSLFKQGDLFGEISEINNKQHIKEFICVISEDAIICTFTKENFEKVLSCNPSICIEYVKQTGEQVLKLQQKYSDLIFKDVRTRLTDFLKVLSKNHGSLKGNHVQIKNILTHQDIADLIGCQRQTVSSLFRELKNENKLDYNRAEIIIHDIEMLV